MPIKWGTKKRETLPISFKPGEVSVNGKKVRTEGLNINIIDPSGGWKKLPYSDEVDPPERETSIQFPTREALDAIGITVAADTTELGLTVSLPPGGSLVRSMLAAFITAMNNTANAQKIDIDVKGRKGFATWYTYFSQDDCIGFPAADGATTGLVALQDVSALVDEATNYNFKCTITQSSPNSVRYTTQYLLIVTYKMS